MRSAVGRVVFAIDRVNDGWWWCCKVFGAEAQARLAAVLNMVCSCDTVRSRKISIIIITRKLMLSMADSEARKLQLWGEDGCTPE